MDSKENINEVKEEISSKEELKSQTKNKKKFNKKILFIIICVIVIVLVLLASILILGNKEKENDDKTSNQVKGKTYFVYMDIVPAVKYEIVEKYSECSTGECLVEILVNNYELMEDDTEGIFDNYKINKQKELNEILNEMLELSNDPDMDVDFYSDNDNIGNYIDIKDFSFGFYLDKNIDTVEEFYGRVVNDDNIYEKIVTKQFVVKDPLIVIKNSNKKYNYSLVDKSSINVTATGTVLDFEDYDYNVDFYVDASSLKLGKNIAKLNVADTNFEFVIEPNEIEVIVIDKASTTTTTTITKSTTTTKTTSRSDVEINLNDNVVYYKGTTCGWYQAIDKTCFNKSKNELMAKYPDSYNKALDDSETKEYDNYDAKLSDPWEISYYFPGCNIDISSSTKEKINNIPGIYADFKNNGIMKPDWIYFKDTKYEKFKGNVSDFTKYGIYDVSACGGGGSGELTYYTLDETACNHYNLPCGRW